MKILGENGIGKFLKIFLQICFFGGTILLIILPFILQIVVLHLNATAYIIYPNGIALLVIVYQFIGLFDSLKSNNPFCLENTKRLKRAGVASLIEAVLWLLDLLVQTILVKSFEPVIILVLIFMFILFIGVSIALYILAELIRQATTYKEENELTI